MLSIFKGGLTENYVFNHLLSNNIKSYYWVSDGVAEVAFIVRINNDIIPIEVKSTENIRSKSLSIYKDINKPKYSIRISLRNFGYENEIKSVPLYAVFCIT